MTGPSVSDRLRLAGLAAGRGLGRVRHSIGAPLRLALIVSGAAVVLLGVFPRAFFDTAIEAAKSFLR